MTETGTGLLVTEVEIPDMLSKLDLSDRESGGRESTKYCNSSRTSELN